MGDGQDGEVESDEEEANEEEVDGLDTHTDGEGGAESGDEEDNRPTPVEPDDVAAEAQPFDPENDIACCCCYRSLEVSHLRLLLRLP